MVGEREKFQNIKEISSSLLLRPLEKRDIKNVCRWMTSSYILQHSFVVPGPNLLPHDFRTIDYAERYFEMLLNDKKRLTFAIVLSDTHIGNIGLKDISYDRLTAECFIEIGEPRFRGCGLGGRAMERLLNDAFLVRGLNRIDLDVLEFNFPALKVYDRLGFVAMGQSGWHYDEFGQYWRVLRMSINERIWADFRSLSQKNRRLF